MSSEGGSDTYYDPLDPVQVAAAQPAAALVPGQYPAGQYDPSLTWLQNVQQGRSSAATDYGYASKDVVPYLQQVLAATGQTGFDLGPATQAALNELGSHQSWGTTYLPGINATDVINSVLRNSGNPAFQSYLVDPNSAQGKQFMANSQSNDAQDHAKTAAESANNTEFWKDALMIAGGVAGAGTLSGLAGAGGLTGASSAADIAAQEAGAAAFDGTAAEGIGASTGGLQLADASATDVPVQDAFAPGQTGYSAPGYVNTAIAPSTGGLQVPTALGTAAPSLGLNITPAAVDSFGGATGALGTAATPEIASGIANAASAASGLGGGALLAGTGAGALTTGLAGLGTASGLSAAGSLAGTGAAGAGGTGSTAASALSKVLNGTATADDYLKLLGQAAPGLLGALGSSQQSSALSDLADKYYGAGAPSRARYEASMTPGFDPTTIPGYSGALSSASQGILSKLSASGGNPYGNPGALIEANKQIVNGTALPAIQNYQTLNAQTGGFAATNAAQPGIAQQAIGSNSGVLSALGSAASSVLNPPQTSGQSLASLLQSLGYGSGSTAATGSALV